jgi:hypothetical protein
MRLVLGCSLRSSLQLIYSYSVAVYNETQLTEYRGFMRVRLQQSVNNFFDARRFDEDEFPMQVL